MTIFNLLRRFEKTKKFYTEDVLKTSRVPTNVCWFVAGRKNVFIVCDSTTKSLAETVISKDFHLKITPQSRCTVGDLEDQIKPDAMIIHS